MSANAIATAEDGDIERLVAADAVSPLDATGLADLIALLAKAKRDGEAAVYAAQLLKLRPNHRRALRALTRSPLAGVDVIGGWRALAESTPEDAEPWLQIARLASRAMDAATALEACDAVLARSDGHAEALGLKLGALSALLAHDDIGSVWRQLHEADAERAGKVLIRAVDDADDDAAAAMLGEAGTLGVLDAEGEHQRLRLRSWLTVRAFGAELAGDDPAAAQDFSRLTRLEPTMADHVDGLKRALARLRDRIDGADAEWDAESGAEAAGAARTLIRFEPRHRNAHLLLARARARAGGWPEAAEAFSQALLLSGDDVDGPLLLEHAAACARCGRLTEAVDSWKRATVLAAADPEARAAAIRARDLLREMAEAGYAAAVEGGDWRAAWASGDALAELEDDASAIQGRRKQLLEATVKALNKAAEGHRPETIDLAHLYLEHAPGDVRARLFLGRALLRERRDAEALGVWQALAADRSDSVEPHLQIARLAKRLGQPRLGLQAADAVLARESRHAEARTLRAYFDQIAVMG